MDPNETLRLLRLTVAQMRVDESPEIRKAHADEIAEYVEALDGWLSGGGFLPDAWLAGRETAEDDSRDPHDPTVGDAGPFDTERGKHETEES